MLKYRLATNIQIVQENFCGLFKWSVSAVLTLTFPALAKTGILTSTTTTIHIKEYFRKEMGLLLSYNPFILLMLMNSLEADRNGNLTVAPEGTNAMLVLGRLIYLMLSVWQPGPMDPYIL